MNKMLPNKALTVKSVKILTVLISMMKAVKRTGTLLSKQPGPRKQSQ